MLLARIFVAAAVCAGVALGNAARAQSVAEFYSGKTITVVVGFSPGGGYDLNARTISRHMGRHLPGKPQMVVQNMPGAGSLTAINHLANIAAKDGTVLGTFSRGVPFEPLMGNKAAQFDPRDLAWIGSPSRETNVLFTWHARPFNSVDDLKAGEMVVATTGSGADTAIFPLVVNAVLNTRLKSVAGYPGASEAMIAVERGEADGIAGLSWGFIKASRPQWISEKQIRVLVQLASARAPDLKDVPTALELAKSDADRQLLELFFARLDIAWPIAAPGNVPGDRIAALRQAFEATMLDFEYRSDAEKQSLEIDPVSGHQIERLLRAVYASPAEVVSSARAIVESSRK